MTNSNALPQITAPSLRVTTSAETMLSYLKGDLKQVEKQAALWVQLTAKEQIANQLALGNSKEYVAIVDGSKSKPISEAQRRVVVYFVTAVLARSLFRAKDVLRRAILRVSQRRTGLLSEGWVWMLQRGKGAPFQLLGATLPSTLVLLPGDAVILVPRAAYAWFVNYYAARKESFVPSERKKGAKVSKKRKGKKPRGFGFMAYAARQLRPSLKAIGISVWPTVVEDGSLPLPQGFGPGVPVLSFVVSRRLARAPRGSQ